MLFLCGRYFGCVPCQHNQYSVPPNSHVAPKITLIDAAVIRRTQEKKNTEDAC